MAVPTTEQNKRGDKNRILSAIKRHSAKAKNDKDITLTKICACCEKYFKGNKNIKKIRISKEI